jgi:hypothetical protein
LGTLGLRAERRAAARDSLGDPVFVAREGVESRAVRRDVRGGPLERSTGETAAGEDQAVPELTKQRVARAEQRAMPRSQLFEHSAARSDRLATTPT